MVETQARRGGGLRRGVDWLLARPVWLVAVYSLATVLLATLQAWHHGVAVREATVIEAASRYAEAVTAFRNFYANEIVPRARRAGVEITEDYHQREAALPLPATMTLDLGGWLSGGKESLLRLYSAYPFPRCAGRPVSGNDEDALREVTLHPDQPVIRFVEENGIRSVQHATSVKMGESCVACHNSHPQSPKQDWKVGDVRGVQIVTFPVGAMTALTFADVFEFSAFMGVVAVGGLLLMTWLLRRLHRALLRSRQLADAAERRNAELAAAKLELEAANRAKSMFLANMSHELRTPLNAIIGVAEVIRAAGNDPDRAANQNRYAEDIQSSGRHLLEIVNDILDMARIDSGHYELHTQECDVHEIVATSMRMLQARAEQGGVALLNQVGDDLPAVNVDCRALRQMLLNLLSNAVKFTPRDGRVTVSAHLLPDRALSVMVADTGIGIPADQIGRVTQPFVQAEGSYARRFEGTGLGLPITKALAELHGGRLTLASCPGRGTEAIIVIPASRVFADAERRTVA
jgi:signal transduction histidine kinase